MPDHITYGTPDQFGSLLRSITVNVDQEPDKTYQDRTVRRDAEALVKALTQRLADTHETVAPAPPRVSPRSPRKGHTGKMAFWGLWPGGGELV